MFKILVALAVLSSFPCLSMAQRPRSVLLTGNEAKRLAQQCSRPGPSDFTETWEPTKEQITEMESRLSKISKLKVKSCCIEGARIEKPEDWYMQYAALVWKGKKIIYISAISTREPERGPCFDRDGIVTDESCEFWKHHAEIICDGGTGWGVVYDVASGKFEDLAVNGVG